MDEDDQFLNQVLSGIAEAEVITIFFPLLRRAIVIDTRRDEAGGQMIRVMPQVNSMSERIRSIERLRPQLGKVRSILGVPWMKSVRRLGEDGITTRLVNRLSAAGMPPSVAERSINEAAQQLWRLERMAFVRMIKGQGFRTLWVEQGRR